jgi:hypothetical protein
MNKRFRSISAPALLALSLSGCQPTAPEIAQVPFEPDSGNLFVRCGALIDGLSDEVLQDRMVVIRDGRFAAVVDGTAEVRPGMTLLNLSDRRRMPVAEWIRGRGASIGQHFT